MTSFAIWHLWIIVAIVLFIAEAFISGLLFACLGAGCLASGGTSYFEFDFAVQAITFSMVTLAAVLSIRMTALLTSLAPSSPGVKTNVDALVGKNGRVSEKINPQTNTGRVIVGGEDWRG